MRGIRLSKEITGCIDLGLHPEDVDSGVAQGPTPEGYIGRAGGHGGG